jgi:hypothetical protein
MIKLSLNLIEQNIQVMVLMVLDTMLLKAKHIE